MHDVAITAWGIKGWYDCIRPISAIRAMADRGQSSDPLGAVVSSRRHPARARATSRSWRRAIRSRAPPDENIGKIKLYAWRGPTAFRTR